MFRHFPLGPKQRQLSMSLTIFIEGEQAPGGRVLGAGGTELHEQLLAFEVHRGELFEPCPRPLSAAHQSSRASACHLWQFYIQLTEVEAAFKTLKDDLGLRPESRAKGG